MEPAEVAQFLSDLAQLMTAGGEHVYAATRQSVMVGIQRDIVMVSIGAGIFGILAFLCLRFSSRNRDDELGWWEPTAFAFGMLLITALLVSAFVAISRSYDLQRVDYLTIEALRFLVR